MKREDISRALGDIDPAFVEEAADQPPGRRPAPGFLRWAMPVAACVGVVLLVVWGPSPAVDGQETCAGQSTAEMAQASSGTAQPPADSSGIGAPENEAERDQYKNMSGSLVCNHARLQPAVHGEVDLKGGDFVPMDRGALLDYYGVELPIPQVLPDLDPLDGPEEQGLWRQEDGQVYRDSNGFSFANAAGDRQVELVLSKASHFVQVLPQLLDGETLQFTPVNGLYLAVFQGDGTLYTEWMQGEVGWRLSAHGLTHGEFYRLLAALISPVEPEPEHSLTGEIGVIDPVARSLWLDPPEGRSIRVQLPQGVPMEDLKLGDRATVTWRGECATLDTVWAQQLMEWRVL